MNVIKRALASVIRKPGKSAALLVIIFILGNIIAGAVLIRQSVESVQLAINAKMSPVTTISFDNGKFDKLQAQNPAIEMKTPSGEAFEKIGTSQYVKYFDYSVLMQMDNLSRYNIAGNTYPYFTFIGVNNPEISDIQGGVIRLVAGRVFNKEEISNLTYMALVSQDFAKANSLTVGSTIAFDYKPFLFLDQTQHYDFQIIGIYEPMETIDEGMENGIYTSIRVLDEAMAFHKSIYLERNPDEKEAYYSPYSYSSLYVLKNPADLEPFQMEAANSLPEYYSVTAAGNSYEKVAVLLQSIHGITSKLLYIAVGAAVATLSLLITLFLRDRRQEIGIYISMGERKIKVAGQILLEVAVIAVIAVSMSLFSGNILSVNLSETMIADQLVANQASEDEYLHNDLAYRYQAATETEDIAESYTVSLNMRIILLFYTIGFGTVCVSVLLPIFYVTRINPKKILMGGEL